MAFVKVKKVYIDKKGNFKMCYSVSNDSRPYATGTFYADSETVEGKVLRFIEGLNDDIVLTDGCTGNVADALAYMLEFSEVEKPLSIENFCNDDCLRNYWYAYSMKQRLRVPYGCTARIVHENYIDE